MRYSPFDCYQRQGRDAPTETTTAASSRFNIATAERKPPAQKTCSPDRPNRTECKTDVSIRRSSQCNLLLHSEALNLHFRFPLRRQHTNAQCREIFTFVRFARTRFKIKTNLTGSKTGNNSPRTQSDHQKATHSHRNCSTTVERPLFPPRSLLFDCYCSARAARPRACAPDGCISRKYFLKDSSWSDSRIESF